MKYSRPELPIKTGAFERGVIVWLCVPTLDAMGGSYADTRRFIGKADTDGWASQTCAYADLVARRCVFWLAPSTMIRGQKELRCYAEFANTGNAPSAD